MSDDDLPLDPAEMLATLRRQQDLTARETSISGALLYLAWGVALVGGNLAFYVGVDRQTLTPPLWSGLVYAALLCGAGVVTWLHIGRRTAGLSSPDALRSTMWGLSWPIVFVAFWLLGVGLVRSGMDEIGAAHYFGIGSMLVVGVQYLGGGAIYRDWWQYVSGCCVLAAAGIAAIVGLPTGYLVLALVGGGSLLLLAALCRRGGSHDRT